MDNFLQWYFDEGNGVHLEHGIGTFFSTAVFTPEECKRIIEIGESVDLAPGLINIGKLDSAIRDSFCSFLSPHDTTDWIFERLEEKITEINKNYFKYDLRGFAEMLQFTRYTEPGGKYKTHSDSVGIGSLVRKLSCTIQLSDPADYEGGDLEIYDGSLKGFCAPKGIGDAAFFNSTILHNVLPVTKGTRYSLVAWVNGPAFR